MISSDESLILDGSIPFSCIATKPGHKTTSIKTCLYLLWKRIIIGHSLRSEYIKKYTQMWSASSCVPKLHNLKASSEHPWINDFVFYHKKMLLAGCKTFTLSKNEK